MTKITLIIVCAFKLKNLPHSFVHKKNNRVKFRKLNKNVRMP